ncbi:MAG: class I SAM-dependent methyltransferase [Sumerlaeia bacterium]
MSAGDHFATEASDYAGRSDRGLWSWWRGRERSAIWRLLRPAAGERVLDAGSGAGYYSRSLIQSGAQVIACDYVPAMAAEVHARLGLPVFVADLQAVGLQPAFDAVLCAGALEFCADPETAIANLAVGLKPEAHARLVLMLPAPSWLGLGYRAFHRRHGVGIQLFSQSRLRSAAGACGLRVAEWSAVGFNHVVRLERGADSR